MLPRKTCVFEVIGECKIIDSPEKLLLLIYIELFEHIYISVKKPFFPKLQ